MDSRSTGLAWQRILPFAVLIPPALLPGSGSPVSLLIVVLTLLLVKASRSPTLALTWKSWPGDILLGAVAGAVLWAVFGFGIDPTLEGIFGRISLDDFSGVRGSLANYLVLLAIGLVYG